MSGSDDGSAVGGPAGLETTAWEAAVTAVDASRRQLPLSPRLWLSHSVPEGDKVSRQTQHRRASGRLKLRESWPKTVPGGLNEAGCWHSRALFDQLFVSLVCRISCAL